MELISRIKAVKQDTQDDATYEMLIKCTSYNTFALFRRLRVVFLPFFLFYVFCVAKHLMEKKVGRK